MALLGPVQVSHLPVFLDVEIKVLQVGVYMDFPRNKFNLVTNTDLSGLRSTHRTCSCVSSYILLKSYFLLICASNYQLDGDVCI
jgi:hypothetical protein